MDKQKTNSYRTRKNISIHVYTHKTISYNKTIIYTCKQAQRHDRFFGIWTKLKNFKWIYPSKTNMDTQNDGWEMASIPLIHGHIQYLMLNFWGVSTAKRRQVTWHHHGQTMWWFSPQGIHRQQKSWEADGAEGVQPYQLAGKRLEQKKSHGLQQWPEMVTVIWLLVPKEDIFFVECFFGYVADKWLIWQCLILFYLKVENQ